MALEMSAAEAPDPVPYAEKLGIAPEDLKKSTAFIHQEKFTNIAEVKIASAASIESGTRVTPTITVRPFEDEVDTDMLVHLDVVTADEILGTKARIFGHAFFDKHCGRNRVAHLEWRTLTAIIGGVPLGFVMYFRYKGRGSGAFSVTNGGERSEIDHSVDGNVGGSGGGSGGSGVRPTSHIKGGYIDLFWILVHPSYRQMGVGSSLIKEVNKRGRAEWPLCDQVRLYVMDSNVNALSLYRTHGFERIKRRENYPEIGTASYRMVRRFEMNGTQDGQSGQSGQDGQGEQGEQGDNGNSKTESDDQEKVE